MHSRTLCILQRDTKCSGSSPIIHCMWSFHKLIICGLIWWKLSSFQDCLYHPWIINSPIMWSNNIFYLTKSVCQILPNELLQVYIFHDHISLGSSNGTYCLKVNKISWTLCWKYLLLSTSSINSDSIHMNTWSL